MPDMLFSILGIEEAQALGDSSWVGGGAAAIKI
jgi:hypothetical protein